MSAEPTSSRPSIPTRELRADIQGLRAFAVVAVILDHLFHWPTGGFVGVDVFFVISGYLITSHMIRELDRTGHLSLSAFYRRRIRRIAPAASLVIVATVAFAVFLLPRGRALSIAMDGIWAFFFGANWRSMAIGTDYFQLGQLPSPLQHFWSLSVEEQFYFVWPLLTMIVFTTAIWRWGASSRAHVATFAAYAAIVALSFVWALVETAGNPTAAYFSTLSRAWELGVGALLALVGVAAWRLSLPTRVGLAWFGVVGLLASVFMIDAESAFPAPTVALPVLATALVIAAGVGADDTRYRHALWPLTNRVSGYLGAISYSLYLWHFPVIVFLATFVPLDSRRYFALVLAGTAILSVISYHFVEEPVRRSTWLLPGSRTKVGRRAAVVATVGTVAVVVAAGLGAARLASPPPETRAPVAAECVGAEAAPGADSDCQRPDAISIDDVTPTLDVLPDDTAGGYSCWRPEGDALKTCTFGSERQEGAETLRVALVGDSHAAALLPAFLDRVDDLGWSLDTYLGYGCQWRDQAERSDCDGVADEVQQRLVDGAYDLVITTGARWANAAAPTDSFVERWDEVASTGADVVVVAAVPTVPDATFACVSRVGADLNECATSRAEALRPPDPMLDAARHADVRVVDMTDFYCDSSVCPAVIGNVIVYRDAAGHTTGTYMKTMAPFLIERIGSAAAVG
ncbi:acyltransferase family protein [Agromyces bauzanensis]